MIAVNENLIFFWNMRDIMNGKLESSDMKKMDKKVIKSEYRNQRNDLYAVFEDSV